MKKYFFILSIATACGCGNKDKLLLDEVPVTPIVNPATKSIIKGNSLVYVRLDSGTVIHGMTPSSAFRTNNFFTDFGLNYLSEPTPTTPYSFDKNTAVYASGQVLSPVVNYSTDYGNSLTSHLPRIFQPGPVFGRFLFQRTGLPGLYQQPGYTGPLCSKIIYKRQYAAII